MMRVAGIIAAGLLVALVAISGVARAGEWQRVTVVTIDGWEYPGVTVTAEGDADHVVLLDGHGGRKRLLRSQVRVIRDSTGKDITEQVFAGVVASAPQRGDETPPAAPSRTIYTDRTIRSKAANGVTPPRGEPRPLGPRFRLGIVVGGGVSGTAGDWYEGMGSGASLDLDLRVGIDENVYVGASYRRQSLGVDSELESIAFYDDFGNIVVVDAEWDIVFQEILLVGGMTTDPYTYRSPLAYLEMGLGSVSQDITVTLSSGPESAAGSSDESDFMMYMGAGVIIPFGRVAGIDLRVSTRYVDADGDLVGFLYGVRAAVTIMLGN